MNLDELVTTALTGEPVTREQALQILQASDADTMPIVAAAGRVRKHFFGNSIALNYLVNIKSGLCPENCSYCSQALGSAADILRYNWLSPEEIRRSVAAGIAGIISSVATMALWFGGGNRRDRDGGNIIAVLLLSLLAPLAATITQFAISRTREYDADHDGAELTQDPLALASALSKLESGISHVPMGQDPRLEPVSSMMIANPFGSLRNLFSTHPPMDKRIARLEQMAGY